MHLLGQGRKREGEALVQHIAQGRQWRGGGKVQYSCFYRGGDGREIVVGTGAA
jgi:hypothetical protein